MREVDADDVTKENQRDLSVPHRTRVKDDRIAEGTIGAQKVPAQTKGIGHHAHDLYTLGDQLAVVMRQVVNEGNWNQREREAKRKRAQRNVAIRRRLGQPDQEQIDRQIDKWRQNEHRPLPNVVDVQEEEIWPVDHRGKNRVDMLPEQSNPGLREVDSVERHRREHEYEE